MDSPKTKRSALATVCILILLLVLTIAFWKLGQPPSSTDSGVRFLAISNSSAQSTSALATAKQDVARKLEPIKRVVFGDPKQIQISARIIELTGPQPPNEWIGPPTEIDKNGTIVWVLAPGQLAAFEKRLSNATNAQILTSPRVITLDGEQATVSVTETKVLQYGNGVTTNANLGTTLGLIPSTIDEESMKVTAIPEVTEFLGYSGKGESSLPVIRKRKTAVSAVFRRDQGMVIGGIIPGQITVGTRTTNSSSGGLLIVLKPKIVDLKTFGPAPAPPARPPAK